MWGVFLLAGSAVWNPAGVSFHGVIPFINDWGISSPPKRVSNISLVDGL